MRNKYTLTVIKDKRVTRHMEDIELDLAIDYFKIYNSPDYYVTVSDMDTNSPILFKREGVRI